LIDDYELQVTNEKDMLASNSAGGIQFDHVLIKDSINEKVNYDINNQIN
jgi:hypothetical protein